jgi:predicted 2-oxoglutarate/Fe(II)-dependent dioxygenase YbiX
MDALAGTSIEHVAVKGDGMVFVSHKWHSVERVTKGNRKTFIIELWAGKRNITQIRD